MLGTGMLSVFPPHTQTLSGECRPFSAWVSQQSALQEVATEVEGLIAPKSRAGGASFSEGADTVLGVAPALRGSLQTHIPGGAWGTAQSPARRWKVTATLVSMRSALSELHAAALGSPPPPLLGNSQSSSQGQLKARDVVCVDFSCLGQGFLEEVSWRAGADGQRDASSRDVLLPAR